MQLSTQTIKPETVAKFADALSRAGYRFLAEGQNFTVYHATMNDVTDALMDRGLLGFIPVHRYEEDGNVIVMVGAAIEGTV